MGEGLLLGVMRNTALRQCFLKFINLCLGKVGVARDLSEKLNVMCGFGFEKSFFLAVDQWLS